jgi:hypothetical protein
MRAELAAQAFGEIALFRQQERVDRLVKVGTSLGAIADTDAALAATAT